MPKLAPTLIFARGESGETFECKYDTSVDSEGTFSVTIPYDQAEDLKRLVEHERGQAGGRVPMAVSMVRSTRSDHYLLRSKLLADLSIVLKHYAEDRVSCETTEDLFIFYQRTADVHYYLGEDGEIYPNGVVAQRALGRSGHVGRWAGGGSDSTNATSTYAVGLWAIVIKRMTHTMKDGRQTFNHVRPDNGQLGEYGLKLDGFVKRPWPAEKYWETPVADPRYPKPARALSDTVQAMPYTEEAARFFYDSMLSICRTADRLSRFFDVKPDELALQIARGGVAQQNLLGPSMAGAPLEAGLVSPEPSATEPASEDAPREPARLRYRP